MPPSFQIRCSGKTDRGIMRPENEDSYLVDEKRLVFAVADGLGGLPEGAAASRMATEGIGRNIKGSSNGEPADLAEIFREINREVFARGREISVDLGIGTTLTAARLSADRLLVTHVGDSGLLRFREGALQQLTVDHTMAQDMRDRLRPGEQAYIPEYFSHTLTRCIGQMETIDVDAHDFEIRSGDRYLIYTDGVTKTHELDELATMVEGINDPAELLERIIDNANERGGPDNCTAVAIYID